MRGSNWKVVPAGRAEVLPREGQERTGHRAIYLWHQRACVVRAEAANPVAPTRSTNWWFSFTTDAAKPPKFTPVVTRAEAVNACDKGGGGDVRKGISRGIRQIIEIYTIQIRYRCNYLSIYEIIRTVSCKAYLRERRLR